MLALDRLPLALQRRYSPRPASLERVEHPNFEALVERNVLVNSVAMMAGLYVLLQAQI